MKLAEKNSPALQGSGEKSVEELVNELIQAKHAIRLLRGEIDLLEEAILRKVYPGVNELPFGVRDELIPKK